MERWSLRASTREAVFSNLDGNTVKFLVGVHSSRSFSRRLVAFWFSQKILELTNSEIVNFQKFTNFHENNVWRRTATAAYVTRQKNQTGSSVGQTKLREQTYRSIFDEFHHHENNKIIEISSFCFLEKWKMSGSYALAEYCTVALPGNELQQECKMSVSSSFFLKINPTFRLRLFDEKELVDEMMKGLVCLRFANGFQSNQIDISNFAFSVRKLAGSNFCWTQ